MLWFIIKLFVDGKKEDQIIKALASDPVYKFLNVNDTDSKPTRNKNFTTSVSSGIFLKEHLPAKARCRICKGHIDAQSITKDHIIRKRDEGIGILQNGQIAHPYCNSIYKR
jgi:hypothetical protein